MLEFQLWSTHNETHSFVSYRSLSTVPNVLSLSNNCLCFLPRKERMDHCSILGSRDENRSL